MLHNLIIGLLLVHCISSLDVSTFKEHSKNFSTRNSSSDRCNIQRELFAGALENGDQWALEMLDSSGSLPVGILSGNNAHMGFYDQCIDIAQNVNEEFIRGKYCYAGLVIPLVNSNLVNDTDLLIANHLKKFQLATQPDLRITVPDGITAPSILLISVCIPDACMPSDIFETIALDNFCSTKERALDRGDISFLVFCSAILLLMCSSTIYDVYLENTAKEKKHPTLLAFSVFTNGRKIFKISKSPDQISCFHGLRAISLLWVIGGHRYVMYEQLGMNQNYISEWRDKWYSFYITVAHLAVDTFMFLTGVLVTYIFLRTMKKPGAKFNLFLFYLHRILRITPAFAALYFFQVTIARRLGSGPMWNMTMDRVRDVCLENWWSVFLYVQNYMDIEKLCLGHTWYLALDMQIFILSPILLIPLLKWSRISKAFLIPSTILASIAIPTVIVYVYNLRYGTMDWFYYYYTLTHNRLAPWVIGLAFGVILHRHQRRKRTFGINRPLNLMVWSAVLVLIGALFIMERKVIVRDDRVEHSLYVGLQRAIWAACLSWISYACIFGYGGIINWFLSWGFFQILGKLSYSMYLVHYSVQYIFLGHTRATSYFDDYAALYETCGDIIFTFFVGLLWCLAFEFPMLTIEKIIFRRESSQSHQKTDDSKGTTNEINGYPEKTRGEKNV